VLILVRHGETALNASRVVQPADTPLSPVGRTQAALLAERLAEHAITHVVCSDLPRARMTAEPILERKRASVRYTDLLQERNFGALRGRPYVEIGRDIFAPDYVPPEGESWSAFDDRVARAWALVREEHERAGGILLVVTHGLVVRSLTRQFLELDAGQAQPTNWGNTSLTICESAPPHRVSLLNCTAHLTPKHVSDPDAPSGL
jgi:probable phosphoglycerate mutase